MFMRRAPWTARLRTLITIMTMRPRSSNAGFASSGVRDPCVEAIQL